eukprot:2945024-Rhodomonas_salina.1
MQWYQGMLVKGKGLMRTYWVACPSWLSSYAFPGTDLTVLILPGHEQEPSIHGTPGGVQVASHYLLHDVRDWQSLIISEFSVDVSALTMSSLPGYLRLLASYLLAMRCPLCASLATINVMHAI